MSDCLFCKICDEGASHSKLVFPFNAFHYFFVIFDPNPVRKGHALIISKQHVKTIFDVGRPAWMEFHQILTDTYIRLENLHSCTDLVVGANCGKKGGQTIFHFHFHLIPGPVPRGGVRNIVSDPIGKWP